MGEPTTEPPATEVPVEDPAEELRWRILNNAVMPVWAAMIIAPRSRLTARLVRASDLWLAGYSIAYVVHLVAGIAEQGGAPDFTSAGVRRAFANPKAFHAGWIHYLAFDLFVGRWIWRRAVDEGRNPRLALFLTLMAGPAGLGVFGLQRRSLSPEHRPVARRT